MLQPNTNTDQTPLKEDLGRPMTPKEVAELLDIDHRTVKKYHDLWGGVHVTRAAHQQATSNQQESIILKRARQNSASWIKSNGYKILKGGGYFTGLDYSDFFVTSNFKTSSNILGNIDQWLHDGYGVDICIDGSLGHALTVYGYEYESGYTGLWYVDGNDGIDRLLYMGMHQEYRAGYNTDVWVMDSILQTVLVDLRPPYQNRGPLFFFLLALLDYGSDNCGP
jgi:hypothetical protein